MVHREYKTNGAQKHFTKLKQQVRDAGYSDTINNFTKGVQI